MFNQLLEKLKDRKVGGFSVEGLALVAAFILAAIFCVYLYNYVQNTNYTKIEVPKEEIVPAETSSPMVVEVGPSLSYALPTRLRIPEIKIDAGFVSPLGLEENNTVAVPDSDTEVGWYQYGPTPGELGPAVILGHIDSYTGPAIFYSLGQVDEGDDIYIDRDDGTTAHFKVEKLERYKQAEFPTEMVYGNISYAGLRLITCSGKFSKGEQKYSHNLVVYARLVE